ncbi:calcium-dependent protein kinase [Purpureocillium lavendulum]|uniref:Calcium-dependent protein kinase n=1 Tax=Purpureocillium lavendulum TaxID=1247861 RepID=A0AB34FJY9_9HYPO|nr:calcium-dependent protein kinase [Purpureocillium lavendulum]
MNHEYVNPDYFRMLRAGNHNFHTANGPPSPVRRLASPRWRGAGRGESDTPRSLQPNYFKTFFVEETVLGRGGKGVVLLVRHEIDGCQLGHFACKRVPVGDDHAWLEKVLIEVELLAKLSHPNLVSYRHVWLEDQYCNSGDLHQYVVGGAPHETTKEELKAQMRRRSKGQAELPHNLNARPQLSFEDIYSLFKDVTSGVAYLHAANYIHRDLKPSNCLLHKEGGKMRCLISDFGEVQPENAVLKLDAAGQYGNFTTKSDMFSLGMILYFMCFGRLPYRSQCHSGELEDIEQLRDEIWTGRGSKTSVESDPTCRLGCTSFLETPIAGSRRSAERK